MKKVFKLILGAIVFNASTMAVQAQSSSSCYMLDINGNPINLSYLCQKSNYFPPRQATKNIPHETQAVRQQGVQIVPINSRRGGIPVIDVKFNNKYTFEMMLDTGASSVVITRQMAARLKVNHTESIYVSTPSNNYFKMPAGYVYSVSVGELKQNNARVITSPSLRMGLLGQSFFGNYDITIKSDVVEFRQR